MTRPAVVAIGRNEGERLRRCIASVAGEASLVVYVDSGSTDGSLELARSSGASVVELDLALPFTAARARNEGLRRVCELAPDTAYVQFVDGDCEVIASWLPRAIDFLQSHPEAAAACGRRRERHPERSVYNMMCDLEWNTPIGPARACGGDVMMRVAALKEVGGYRDALIAGEEPELCVRLRAKGWQVWRLDAEMTLHDAALLRFGQWWKRTLRGGYAFAEGARLHGAPPERHWVRESRSAWLWGVAVPVVLCAVTWRFGPVALLAWAVYPLQVLRLSLRGPEPLKVRAVRATFLMLGKFAEAAGQLKYLLHRLAGVRGRIIEYK
ncbi:MAG TPA: glycosyltransferase [Albitalea sp.]|nr:glycosyltransferase [Albitalea sp.]